MADFDLKNAENKKPHSADAEKSVISCLIQDNSKIDEVFAVLSVEMFYDPLYQAMFKSIGELRDELFFVDKVTIKDKVLPKSVIKEEIKKKVVYKQNFDPERLSDEFFADLIMSVPITSNVMDYCNIVKDKYIMRKTIEECQKVITDCMLGHEDINDILNGAQGNFFKFSKTSSHKDYIRIDDAIPELLDSINAAAKTKDGVTGVRTGYHSIDTLTAGFQKTDMIVLAARPATGKTSFALNLAYNISKYGKSVMFFSLEMSARQLLMRLLAMETGISSSNLRSGRLNDNEWGNIVEGVKRITGTSIYVDDNNNLTIADFRNKCLKLKSENKLDIVMIDYLQLMHIGNEYSNGKRGYSNRQEEVAEISRSIKALAKELDIPIIALSQLTREADAKKRPQLSDIRESGAIEQDADIVILLHSDRNNPEAEDKSKTYVDFAKHRNGQTQTIALKFINETTRFVEYTNESI